MVLEQRCSPTSPTTSERTCEVAYGPFLWIKVYSSEMTGASVSTSFAAGWYNSFMWKPLFAGALLIAIAVAIIAPTFYMVDPWLNVWMRSCSRSAWSAGPVLEVMSDFDRALVELWAANRRSHAAT